MNESRCNGDGPWRTFDAAVNGHTKSDQCVEGKQSFPTGYPPDYRDSPSYQKGAHRQIRAGRSPLIARLTPLTETTKRANDASACVRCATNYGHGKCMKHCKRKERKTCRALRAR